MNERIKELITKATIIEYGIDNGFDRATFDKEKFAELIVWECVEVCRQGKYGRKDDLDTIQFDNGIRFCMNAIDNHFGD